MAGFKETPRQKMISMMYLVLTALLALNVSADILDAFAIVNDGLEKTNASTENKIEDYYRTFEQQYNKQPEKVQQYWDKAQLIRTKTDEIINYIENEIKVPMVLQTENIESVESFSTRKMLTNLSSETHRRQTLKTAVCSTSSTLRTLTRKTNMTRQQHS